MKELSLRSTFDPSQLLALNAALTNEVVLVQGTSVFNYC